MPDVADLADTNLGELVRRRAAERPDAVALVHVDRRGTRTETTWAALDRDVDALAAGLAAELGLRPGDRVAMVLPNSPEFVTTYFAVLRAGMVAVPVNTGYTAPEIARLLGEADAKVVFCSDDVVRTVEEAVAETKRAHIDEAGYESVLAGGRAAGPVEAVSGDEDLAVLLFTSGTSGKPRGAMLSHRALLANVDQCLRLDPTPMVADDVVLLVLPLFHVYGLNAGLGTVAATGARAVLVERFDPRGSLDLVAAEGVTNVPGAPAMYAAWTGLDDVELGTAMQQVRVMVSGAAPLSPTVLEQIRTQTGCTVHEGYGLTETAPVLTSTLASERVKPGSVGRPVPGVELRLVDEAGAPLDGSADDDAGDGEDAGDTGEIQARGANLFSGYWPDGREGPDADGWWSTGDVGYLDDDGDLFLVDRRRELVLVSGFNVYPREVEDVIAAHPDVAEVAVIAVPHPSTGEAVKAYVVARPGATLRPEDVTSHCATRLARFKRPTIVAVVDALPHSATGKVAKGALREDLA